MALYIEEYVVTSRTSFIITTVLSAARAARPISLFVYVPTFLAPANKPCPDSFLFAMLSFGKLASIYARKGIAVRGCGLTIAPFSISLRRSGRSTSLSNMLVPGRKIT